MGSYNYLSLSMQNDAVLYLFHFYLSILNSRSKSVLLCRVELVKLLCIHPTLVPLLVSYVTSLDHFDWTLFKTIKVCSSNETSYLNKLFSRLLSKKNNFQGHRYNIV